MKIEYNNDIQENFIPVSYDEILSGVLNYLKKSETKEYREFANLLSLYYYNKFYIELRELKKLYQLFNPDRETITHNTLLTPLESKKKEIEFFKEIKTLLKKANYIQLTNQMLFEALNKVSPYGVQVNVDFDDFEKIEIYFRGEAIQYDQLRDAKKLFLTKKEIKEPIYRRLFVIIKPKLLHTRAKEIALESKKDLEKVKKKLKKHKPHLLLDELHKNIYIKLFKNIPHSDLEMICPNTKVKMTLFDKIKLSVVGGGGTIGGISTLLTKLSVASTNPISTLIAIGTFFAILFRQVKEVLYKRNHYLAKLSQRLYFHNLDNNEGAISHIVNSAFVEESKEALLVYLFLESFKKSVSIEQLDSAIEEYFDKEYKTKIDFEVDDGIRKLKELGLIYERNGFYTVEELENAIIIVENILQNSIKNSIKELNEDKNPIL